MGLPFILLCKKRDCAGKDQAMTDNHTHRGDDVHPVEAAMRDDGDWQPIATAPKDGTEILLYGPCQWDTHCKKSKPKICVAAWGVENDWDDEEDKSFMTSSQNPYQDVCHATHWMPLPAAPTEGE
jgi:hypothetical protein